MSKDFELRVSHVVVYIGHALVMLRGKKVVVSLHFVIRECGCGQITIIMLMTACKASNMMQCCGGYVESNLP